MNPSDGAEEQVKALTDNLIALLPAVNHQPEFTQHCVSEAANNALIDGALAMAMTAIDPGMDAKSMLRLTGARA